MQKLLFFDDYYKETLNVHSQRKVRFGQFFSILRYDKNPKKNNQVKDDKQYYSRCKNEGIAFFPSNMSILNGHNFGPARRTDVNWTTKSRLLESLSQILQRPQKSMLSCTTTIMKKKKNFIDWISLTVLAQNYFFIDWIVFIRKLTFEVANLFLVDSVRFFCQVTSL